MKDPIELVRSIHNNAMLLHEKSKCLEEMMATKQPTKTLYFDGEVLEVLRNMQWREDGLRGLIEQQLDRALYVRVNKALEAMGGKWNKSAKAHVFGKDPRPDVDGLLDTGEIVIVKDGFFETPDNVVVDWILPRLELERGMSCLEPEAGKGAIAKHLKRVGAFLTCIELNEERSNQLALDGYDVIQVDFLEWDCSGVPFKRIAMNPPFENSQDIAHVRHAYDQLAVNGILVAIMGEGAFFRDDNKAVEFREWLKSVKGQGEELPDSSFRESGSNVKTRIVTIKRGKK